MKYKLFLNIIVFCVFTTFSGAVSQSFSDEHEIIHVRNYNMVTRDIATSGTIYKTGYEELKANGFATILDLRTPKEGVAEESSRAQHLHMNYINMPVYSAVNISLEQVAKFAEIVESAPKPLLIHCVSGNRVGAMWSLYQMRKGDAVESAYKVGRAIGLRSDVEEQLRRREHNNACTHC